VGKVSPNWHIIWSRSWVVVVDEVGVGGIPVQTWALIATDRKNTKATAAKLSRVSCDFAVVITPPQIVCQSIIFGSWGELDSNANFPGFEGNGIELPCLMITGVNSRVELYVGGC
jgi:hypothetical protein